MPELPEVETIVRTLETALSNQRIAALALSYTPLMEQASEYPLTDLIGARFEQFRRRGKYLWFTFDNGLHWICHLRMEGKFNLYEGVAPAPSQHTHLIIRTHGLSVHYLDTRKFSRMAVVSDPHAYFLSKHLGLEPFDPQLDDVYLHGRIHRSVRAIKSILLDQTIICGIGNIYADEILFACRIHPLRRGCDVTIAECKALIAQAQIVLKQAIQAGGTTVRTYTSARNVDGRFQRELMVYGRSKQPCKICARELKRRVIGSRSTVFCPQCQKEDV